MNRKTAEKIAAIVLLGVLCMIFVIQNAHAMKHTKSYWVGFKIDEGNDLNTVHAIDDSCDVAAYNHGITNTTECIAGYQAGWEKTCAIGVAKFGTADVTANGKQHEQ